eukprot:CAMPEP_0174256130 /NCGR_PEP_ID=MMETSP0439-20130205/5381_1 /TAXON_ID=0 /ORGANISM="Stereomyxa ramosa, Strain Chinc5" /LENGTH=355 /DNA_ID=CAMNT_0015338599 /DNA_START=659 /DNA_END=1726 /DNA_ORIENTATION=-
MNEPKLTTCKNCGTPRGYTKNKKPSVIVTNRTPSNLDGTYNASFSPLVTGVHRISIKYKGTHIKGSPFDVVIEEPIHTKMCSANFEENKSTYVAGEKIRVIIHARNKKGEDITIGGETFRVQVFPQSSNCNLLNFTEAARAAVGVAPTTITDLKNGKYLVEFSVEGTGPYLIDIVRFSKYPIGNMLEFFSVCGETHGATCSLSQKTHIFAPGSMIHFTIQATDKFDNQRTSGGDAFTFHLVNYDESLLDSLKTRYKPHEFYVHKQSQGPKKPAKEKRKKVTTEKTTKEMWKKDYEILKQTIVLEGNIIDMNDGSYNCYYKLGSDFKVGKYYVAISLVNKGIHLFPIEVTTDGNKQ